MFAYNRRLSTLLAWIVFSLGAVFGEESVGHQTVSPGGTLLDLSRYIAAQNSPDSFVHVSTSMGNFTLELLPDSAPATVLNFLNYVKSGTYQGTLFHRSVPGFIVQTGGFSLNGAPIPTNPPVINEYNVSNLRGTVAMAKVEGNPDSATNQWFVNLGDNSANLDNQNGGFTVFARVMDPGMAVVDAIASLNRVDLGGTLGELPVRKMTADQTTLNLENLVWITGATPSSFYAKSSNPRAFSAEIIGGSLRLVPGVEAKQGASITVVTKNSEGTPSETTFSAAFENQKRFREFAVMEISSPSLGSGTIEFELWPEAAPKTVSNFRYLAESGFYDNTKFHRLLRNLMIEGGDPLTRHNNLSSSFGSGGPGYEIPDEFSNASGRSHVRGVISMANAGTPRSGGSVFSIMLGEDRSRDGNYTSFGNVSADPDGILSSLSQIQNSASLRVTKDLEGNEIQEYSIPAEPVSIQRVRIRREFAAPALGGLVSATYGGKLESPRWRAHINGNPLDRTNYFATSVDALQVFSGSVSSTVIQVPMSMARNAGAYGVSVTRLGSVSGKVRYYGLEYSFTGVARKQADGTYFCEKTLGLNGATPLKIELRLQGGENEAPGILAVRVLSFWSPSEELAVGASEPAAPLQSDKRRSPLLALLTQPNWYNNKLQNPIFQQELKSGSYAIGGLGALSLRTFNRNTAILGSGFLPDGRPLTFSSLISKEGPRSVIPVFRCELFPELQAQYLALRFINPFVWWPLSYLQGSCFIAGDLEIPALDEEPRLSGYSWFNAFNKKHSGIAVPEYFGSSQSILQEYTPPRARQPLPSFPQNTGILQIPEIENSSYRFRIARDQRTVNFPDAPGIYLRLDPLNGTFSGSVPVTLGGSTVRAPVRGALYSDSEVSGVGHLLTPRGTTTVKLLPAPASGN